MKSFLILFLLVGALFAATTRADTFYEEYTEYESDDDFEMDTDMIQSSILRAGQDIALGVFSVAMVASLVFMVGSAYFALNSTTQSITIVSWIMFGLLSAMLLLTLGGLIYVWI